MIPTTLGWRRILRIGLILSACGWGISFGFTFTSWEVGSEQLYLMGADQLEYDPLLNYWLKMASCVFGCIGIVSALAAWKPDSFRQIIQLLVPFHLIVGITLVGAALANHLTPVQHPTFIPDITFCFLTAILIGVPLFKGWQQREK